MPFRRHDEVKRRAPAVVRGGPQPPAVGGDDRSADGEPHAHALGLGRIEGLEELVEGLRGETDAARTASLEGLELAEGSGARPVAVLHTANLGFLELSAADAGRANRYLGPLADAALEAGIHEPGVLRYLGDAAEALVGVGDVERAGSLLDALEVSGERVARISTLVTATRGRALLDAALGDLTSATSAAERSLERAERLGQPFELARTLLVLGTVRRRDRRKKDARDALERALEIFQGLGARMWAERLGDEARFGAALDELWPRAVAALDPDLRPELARRVGREPPSNTLLQGLERGAHAGEWPALWEEMTMVRRSVPGAAW